MPEFQLGDYVLIEIALAAYAKDLDISLFAAQQVQDIVMKVEMNIRKISQATAPLEVVPIGDEKGPSPKA